MHFGPIIHRELLRESRHITHFVGRVVFLGALVAAIAYLWYTSQVSLSYLTVAFRGSRRPPQDIVAEFGTRTFAIWAVLQYFAVCAFSTFRAAKLADERRTGSLDLIRATRLGDFGIILGSFFSVIGRALFTMILALPLIAINRSFGGFTLVQAFYAIVITLLAAANGAALTLLIASRFRSTGNTIIASVIIQVGAYFLMARLLWYLSFNGILSNIGTGLFFFHSFDWLRFIIEDSSLFDGEIATYFLWHFLPAMLCLLFAALSLKKNPRRSGSAIKKLLKRADRFFLKLSGNRLVLWKTGLGRLRGNPILWRERAVSLLGQRDHMIRIFYWSLLAFTSVGLLGIPLWGIGFLAFTFFSALVGLPLLLMALFFLVQLSTAFARERQKGTLELIAATRLTAKQLVIGKLLFCLRSLLFPAAIILISGVCYFFVYADNFYFFPTSKMLLYVLLLASAALAIFYVTAGAQSTTKAIVGGAAVLAVLYMFFFLAGITFQRNIVHFLFSSGPNTPIIFPFLFFAIAFTVLTPHTRWASNSFIFAGVLLTMVIIIFSVYLKGRAHIMYGELAVPLVFGIACSAFLTFCAFLNKSRGLLFGAVTIIVLLLLYYLLPETLIPHEFFTCILLGVIALYFLRAFRHTDNGLAKRVFLVSLYYVFLGILMGLPWKLLIPVIPRIHRDTVSGCILLMATICMFFIITVKQIDRSIGRYG